MRTRVLLVGGPNDGTWVHSHPSDQVIMTLDPAEIESDTTRHPGYEPTRHMYEVLRMDFMGYHLWVGMHEATLRDGGDRNAAVLRAILQRDVATETKVR